MPLRKDQDRSQGPRWIRIGLWGIKTRRAATFGWIVIAFSVFGWVLLLASSISDWFWLVSEGIQVGFFGLLDRLLRR